MNQDLSEGSCLASVVSRDHGLDVIAPMREYEERLRIAGLTDVPFHDKDLPHGHGRMDGTTRSRLRSQAVVCPVRIHLRFDNERTAADAGRSEEGNTVGMGVMEAWCGSRS